MRMHRATIRRFDPATWRADVELTGAPAAVLPGVPVAGDIGPGLLPAGTRVWVCLSDEGNPADGAVLAPYGATPAPWVTSRLWRPALASAEGGPAACTSTAFEPVPGLGLTLTLEVNSTVLLWLAAAGSLGPGASGFALAFFHDDSHETTPLLPAATPSGEGWAVAWLALQSGVAAGTHNFTVRQRVAAGTATLQSTRAVALAMGG